MSLTSPKLSMIKTISIVIIKNKTNALYHTKSWDNFTSSGASKQVSLLRTQGRRKKSVLSIGTAELSEFCWGGTFSRWTAGTFPCHVHRARRHYLSQISPDECDALTASIVDMGWFNDQKAVSGVLSQSGRLTSLQFSFRRCSAL